MPYVPTIRSAVPRTSLIVALLGVRAEAEGGQWGQGEGGAPGAPVPGHRLGRDDAAVHHTAAAVAFGVAVEDLRPRGGVGKADAVTGADHRGEVADDDQRAAFGVV